MMTDNKAPDPRSLFDLGEIPMQTQPEPGIEGKILPKVGYGEYMYKGHGRLKGRKALITGGDSGIGRAVAIAFAREGADIAISYLSSEQPDADDVRKIIEDAGQKVLLLPGDLRDEHFTRRMVHDAYDGLGGLDIVVNNAAKQIFNDDITALKTEQLLDTFTVNIFAMFWIVQEALQHLTPGSVIINTTSIQATQPSPGLLDYAATKGAITNFTRGLAQQLTPKGVRVNAVAPGPIWTPLQPSRGQPAELAGAYVFLASDEASYISGEVIGVTGGELR